MFDRIKNVVRRFRFGWIYFLKVLSVDSKYFDIIFMVIVFQDSFISIRVGFFCVRVGLFFDRSRTFFGQRRTFFDRSRTFLAGGGLFLSPTVAEKSPTPAEKSPTAIPKRCWTLEYFGELEFSSPFLEQWTLDARGVLCCNSLQRNLFILLRLNCRNMLESDQVCIICTLCTLKCNAFGQMFSLLRLNSSHVCIICALCTLVVSLCPLLTAGLPRWHLVFFIGAEPLRNAPSGFALFFSLGFHFNSYTCFYLSLCTNPHLCVPSSTSQRPK